VQEEKRMHPVLVTGATGRVGRAVVDQLLGAGVPVRALMRRPATAGLPATVEVVGGDLTVPESLDAALQGVGAVFLLLTTPARVADARRITNPTHHEGPRGPDVGLFCAREGRHVAIRRFT
jgi:uncharacterized protein YbjT (DUF2867 family)